MADVKAVLVEVPSIVEGGGPGSKELFSKGAIFTDYTPGPLPDASVDPSWVTEGDLQSFKNLLADGKELIRLDLTPSSNFEEELFQILDDGDRKTIYAVLSPKALAFYGHGVEKKAGKIERQAKHLDVLPTLSVVAEFFLTKNIKGSILYEALKNPNYKLSTIGKLKAALGRLEKVLKRDNQEPWDKHDCA
jgi:hypothetical protein